MIYSFLFFLAALTPRLLITLGEQCDFKAQELTREIDAVEIEGTEEEMATQIQAIDTLNQTHLIVLSSPVANLEMFAARFFYDSIHLNQTSTVALQTLQDKIASTPTTDADLPCISPETRGLFYRLMETVSNTLKDQNIPFWAISGTLLGAARHQGMIPWDDDLDIIIHVRDRLRLEHLANLLDRQGLQLYIYSDYFYKIFPKNGEPIYAENGSAYPWKYPFLDIFTVNKLQGKIRIVSRTYPRSDLYNEWWLEPKELKMPPLFLPFGPLTIPAPRNYENILSREYGADWKIAAYLWHNHATEMRYKRVKVPITDTSSPPYLLPH